MISIKAKYYDGKRSEQKRVVLNAPDSGLLRVERIDSHEVICRCNPSDIRISDRLGDTPRFINFPDGLILETEDNAAVDRLQKKMKRGKWTGRLHLLESRTRYLLPACVMVLVLGALTVIYGVPAAAKAIAASLPRPVYGMADRQTLAFIDSVMLKPSELPDEIERRIRTRVQGAVSEHASLGIHLLFRKGGKLGPNAFALPGGTIIMTDELVGLAGHDDELLSVMAHEIGHVVHHHAMRRMVQDSLLSFAILALTGDASGVSELFLGLPVILTELAYSREFEREADRYALSYLRSHQVPPSRFADILERIARSYKEQKGTHPDDRWSGYLSTHPPTASRVKLFRQPADVNGSGLP